MKLKFVLHKALHRTVVRQIVRELVIETKVRERRFVVTPLYFFGPPLHPAEQNPAHNITIESIITLRLIRI